MSGVGGMNGAREILAQTHKGIVIKPLNGHSHRPRAGAAKSGAKGRAPARAPHASAIRKGGARSSGERRRQIDWRSAYGRVWQCGRRVRESIGANGYVIALEVVAVALFVVPTAIALAIGFHSGFVQAFPG